jgi:prepilin peptidase CpaA
MSVAFWVPAGLLLGAAVVDLGKREIPDAFPLLLVVWAVTARAAGIQPPDWVALGLGAALGLAVGAVLFATGAFGGGDAKLLAGLGAVLGPFVLLVVLAWMAVFGGAVALLALVAGRSEIPYGPAIAAGYLLAVLAA